MIQVIVLWLLVAGVATALILVALRSDGEPRLRVQLLAGLAIGLVAAFIVLVRSVDLIPIPVETVGVVAIGWISSAGLVVAASVGTVRWPSQALVASLVASAFFHLVLAGIALDQWPIGSAMLAVIAVPQLALLLVAVRQAAPWIAAAALIDGIGFLAVHLLLDVLAGSAMPWNEEHAIELPPIVVIRLGALASLFTTALAGSRLVPRRTKVAAGEADR
ncbi:MAG: hypothetical protein ACRDGV_00680 [Candidatus Limnocylindria bacterium]